jgi:hypothetical protein
MLRAVNFLLNAPGAIRDDLTERVLSGAREYPPLAYGPSVWLLADLEQDESSRMIDELAARAATSP